MAYQWEDKIVLITGFATDIGAAVVRILLEEHVKVPTYVTTRRCVKDLFQGSFKAVGQESAAQGVVDVYKQAESGSTWVATNGRPAKDISATIKKAFELMSVHAF